MITKSYEEVINELSQRSGYDLTLSRMIRADKSLGSPSRSFHSVHIAGTNGKGTVALNIANALTQSGYKTGLYTSPHIHTVRERIQIDGKMIDREKLHEILEKLLPLTDDLTFFEVLTLTAFCHFKEEEIDIAVIETGLGGTYDATNIVIPKLTLITNISYDHRNYLGDELEDIARNKAGIMKPGVPVVLGANAALRSMFQRALHIKAPITVLPKRESYEEENAELVRSALKSLSLNFRVQEGLEMVNMPCRMEKHTIDGVETHFDMAHNEASLEQIKRRLAKLHPDCEIVSLFNISVDKEVSTCVEVIKSFSTPFWFRYDHTRLSKCIEDVEESTPLEALAYAKRRGAIFLVCGSAFIMHPVMEELGVAPEADPEQLTD